MAFSQQRVAMLRQRHGAALRSLSARHRATGRARTVFPILVLTLALGLAPRPVAAQIDTPAARNARSALAELRKAYGDTSNWRLWSERLVLDALDRELMAGQFADRRIIDHAAGVLKKTSQSRSLPPAFLRLADALTARSEELAPIPPEAWLEECRRQAASFAPVTARDVSQRRQRASQQLDAVARRIPSLRDEGSRWSAYLDWQATRRLLDADPTDVAALAGLPDPAALDRMETRWAAALTVWDAPELVEASFAVQAYIRSLRALRKAETAEHHAAAWNELADLLEARGKSSVATPDAAEATAPAERNVDSTGAGNDANAEDSSDDAKPADDAESDDADGTDDPDSVPDNTASHQSSAARIAELLAERESLGQSSRLTVSIRREISHPNVVARIAADWLAAQFQTSVDEKYAVDGVYGGTYSRGRGRIRGNVSLALVPSQSSAQWRLGFQATAQSRSAGSEQGVSVDSRSTTRIHSEKLFTLSAQGLAAQRAIASATTNVVIENINAGGGARGRRAPGEVRARIPAVEADVSADAQRTAISRLDAEGGKLVERFNNNYHENFRNPWITSGRLLPRIRSASTRDMLYWECYLASPYGMAADAPPPAFDGGGGVVVGMAESALEQQAASAWAGRRMTGDALLASLEQVLGESPTAESGEEAEPEPQDWIVSFAEVPCRVRIDDGNLIASLYFTTYEEGDASFPAMTVQVTYAVEERDGNLALVRQGTPSVRPTPLPGEEDKPLTGRQRSLRLAAQFNFNKMLAEEIVWSGMSFPVSAQSAPVMRVNKTQASGGWLQVGLRSEAAQSP